MDIREAIKNRHSVRQFLNEPIPEDAKEQLEELILECNRDSGMNIQIVYDDPECFNTFLAHYGKFKNANHYIALVGPKTDALDELAGYYGEKLVLKATQLGLSTCWVGGSYGRGKVKIKPEDGEKLVCVIAIGIGATKGAKHSSKPVEKLCDVHPEKMPTWFKNGMVAALMAPTALNQQKFFVSLDGDEVTITAKRGPFTKVDLGIVKYHFEMGSGHKVH